MSSKINAGLRLCGFMLPALGALFASVNVAAAATTFEYDGYNVVYEKIIHVTGPVDAWGGMGEIILQGKVGTASEGLTKRVWCVDLYDYLINPGIYTQGTLSPAYNTGAGGSMTTQQIGQIGALINHADAEILANHNASAAIQMAIWHVEYGNSFTFTYPSGTSAVALLADTYYHYVTDPSPTWAPVSPVQLYFAVGNQNMAFLESGGGAPPVPLPAALPLFATGLGALGVLGWRKKRKAAAAA